MKNRIINLLLTVGVIISAALAVFFHYRNTEQQRTDEWIREIAIVEEETAEAKNSTVSAGSGVNVAESISLPLREDDNPLVSVDGSSTEDLPVYQNPIERKIDFYELSEVNPDIVAWLYIPGTYIDYPILCAPQGEDEDYYLRRDLRGRYNPHGSLYIRRSEGNIIYGHNMRDGTMFGTLKKISARDLYLYSPTETLHYHLSGEETVDPESVPDLASRSDLTLCTCTSNGRNRFLTFWSREMV